MSNAHETFLQRVDEKIRRLEAELAGWKEVRKAAAESPAFVADFTAMLSEPASNGTPRPELTAPARQPDVPHWQRVRRFILANGNQWVSVRQIRAGTGIREDSVRDVLYTAGRKWLFEKRHDTPKRVLWRVKEDFTDDSSLPLDEEPPENEPQDAQPQEQPAANEPDVAVEEPKPQRTGPRPKHASANWGEN